jgi:hypothetical protein
MPVWFAPTFKKQRNKPLPLLRLPFVGRKSNAVFDPLSREISDEDAKPQPSILAKESIGSQKKTTSSKRLWKK